MNNCNKCDFKLKYGKFGYYLKCIICNSNGFLNKKEFPILNFKSEDLSLIIKDMWKHGFTYSTNQIDLLIWSDNKIYYDSEDHSEGYEKNIIVYSRFDKNSDEDCGDGQTVYFTGSGTTLMEIIHNMSDGISKLKPFNLCILSEWAVKVLSSGSNSLRTLMEKCYKNKSFDFYLIPVDANLIIKIKNEFKKSFPKYFTKEYLYRHINSFDWNDIKIENSIKE